MDKVIAVDIDNVLNNFDDTLKNINFPYDKNNYSWGSVHISERKFQEALAIIKQQGPLQFDDRTINSIWNHAHQLSHKQAQVKPGASEFMWYLKQHNYRIIIMTRRDLRYTLEYTKDFLENNNLPYDDLFNSNSKILTCSLWHIPILIDDEVETIASSSELPNPVQVYYPIMDKHQGLADNFSVTAIGYHYFKELTQWIK